MQNWLRSIQKKLPNKQQIYSFIQNAYDVVVTAVPIITGFLVGFVIYTIEIIIKAFIFGYRKGRGENAKE